MDWYQDKKKREVIEGLGNLFIASVVIVVWKNFIYLGIPLLDKTLNLIVLIIMFIWYVIKREEEVYNVTGKKQKQV